MMWSKPRSVPALVTTSDPTDGGVLGAPTTETLFGGNLGNEVRNGGQITAGRWLGVDGDLGLGIRLMAIESNSSEFSETATFGMGSSDRLLARPYLDATSNEAVELIAGPGPPLT
ncbi:MAG: BBP7 family outer membrane beta-barrel protein, partial [Pirellulaceae bacterium]